MGNAEASYPSMGAECFGVQRPGLGYDTYMYVRVLGVK